MPIPSPSETNARPGRRSASAHEPPVRAMPQRPASREVGLSRPARKLLKQCSRPVRHSLGLDDLDHSRAGRGFKGLNQTRFLSEIREQIFSIPIDEAGLRTARRMKKLGLLKELHATVDLFGKEHAHLRLTRTGATHLFRLLKEEQGSRVARQLVLPFNEILHSPPWSQ